MITSLYSKDTETKDICIFLEQRRSSLAPVSLELLSKGRELASDTGWTLTGLLLGYEVGSAASEAFEYGADRVILIDNPKLELFTVDAYTYVAYQIMEVYRPTIFLLGATMNGRDLAGRLAVRLRTGLNADCSGLQIDANEGQLVCEVSGFGGGILALIEMQEHRPQMATVRPGVFLPSKLLKEKRDQVIRPLIEIPDEIIRTRVIERVIGEGVDLGQASVVVAGGRGVEGNFEMLEELAQLLDGDYGATRPPVDDGFVERERQIGQTGVVCRPDLTIVCGISGAFHFVVGIQESGTIIAVNSDRDAPIFDYADYCVVGDLNEILPSLIRALRDIKVAEMPA
jgi:electron transfer flavoprotein alpha subunit